MLHYNFFLNKQVGITIFVLFFSFFAFSQIDEEINKILLKKNFSAFLNFTDRYSTSQGDINIYKGNIRELVHGFSEAFFTLIKSYPVNKAVNITCESKIKILTRGKHIIYFHFERKRLQGLPESATVITDTTYQYFNSQEIAAMNVAFEKVFLIIPDKSDLFIDTIYYGQSCGHSPKGHRPYQGEQIDKWINAVDTANLTRWLQSANMEKQVYAVEGFYSLLFKGVRLSDDIKNMINSFRKKKGTINLCGICDSRQSDVAGVVQWIIDNLGKQQTHTNYSVK